MASYPALSSLSAAVCSGAEYAVPKYRYFLIVQLHVYSIIINRNRLSDNLATTFIRCYNFCNVCPDLNPNSLSL